MNLVDLKLNEIKYRRQLLDKLSHKPFRLYKPSEDEIKRFYRSTAWLSVRKLILNRDGYIDQFELLNHHRIIPGKIVHHIIELRDRWDLRLEPLNLECINAKNHNTEHPDRRGSLAFKNKLDRKQIIKLKFNVGSERPTEEL